MSDVGDMDIRLGVPAWVRGVAQIGFPSVVALIFLGALLGIIPSRISTVSDNIIELNSSINQLAKEHRDLRQRLDQTAYYQSMLLRVICYSLSDVKHKCEPKWQGYDETEGGK